MITFGFLLISLTYLCLISSAAQQGPEINDQFESTNSNETIDKPEQPITEDSISKTDIIDHDNKTRVQNIPDHSETYDKSIQTTARLETKSFITKMYIAIRKPFIEFIEEPRVNGILKNMGTCLVNGAMEIVSYYFPAPLIPLIASAAGSIIPFEPVVMLRKRMPVTSYRRAFSKAINSFLGTFDRFKMSEEDPYMTRRFNRRFMQENSAPDEDNE